MFWDDEDYRNSNYYTGTLPDGVYGLNTKIYFCCRSDGSYLTPIALPTSTPFYLYRLGGDCQRVSGMSITGDYIITDDENSFNQNLCTGLQPAGGPVEQRHVVATSASTSVTTTELHARTDEWVYIPGPVTLNFDYLDCVTLLLSCCRVKLTYK